MKILQLCIRVPYPPRDGGSIAMYNNALGLSDAEEDVTILALNTKKHYINVKQLPEDFLSWSNMKAVDINTNVAPWGALLNLFSRGSYNVDRFYSKKFENILIGYIKDNRFDIIQLETMFFAPYVEVIRKHCSTKVVLRAHNVEHVIWQRLAIEEKHPFKRLYLEFLGKRLMQVELDLINKVDAIVSITAEDAAFFKQHNKNIEIHVTPIGLDMARYMPVASTNVDLKLFHLGAMDWMPNVEAVEWLLKKVWPIVRKIDGIELHIAGAGMPEDYFDITDDKLFVYGAIEDATDFYVQRDVMLVPVFSGSGMRVKIVEGFAMGRAVVSTTIGAEGIPAVHGKEIMIADTAEDFAAAIQKLNSDRSLLKAMEDNAREFAELNFDNAMIAENLVEFYESILT